MSTVTAAEVDQVDDVQLDLLTVLFESVLDRLEQLQTRRGRAALLAVAVREAAAILKAGR